jgi:hypothetical protein
MGSIVPTSRSGTACRAPTVEVLTVYIRRNRAADPQRLKPQRKELVTARLKSCPDVREFSGIAGAGGWPSQAALKRICGAVNNHERLCAREDGAKPSPPRDCKAEIFGACHCSEL